MRITFVNTFYHPHADGGAEHSLKRLAEGLAGRGHEVAVFATHGEREPIEEEVNGVRVRREPIANVYWPFRTRPSAALRIAWNLRDIDNRAMGARFERFLEQRRPDVVVFNNIRGISISAWTAARRHKIPGVQILRDLYLACPPTTMFHQDRACETQCGRCRVFRGPHKQASRRLDAVVGVSRYITERVQALGLFDGVPAHTIYNRKAIAVAEAARQRRSAKVFGYIGTLAPAKGLEWMLQEMKTLAAPPRLLIAGVGDPAYVQHLKAAAAGQNVEFLGYAPASEFFSRIDVCCVPSLWPDTLPGVAIEAAAYGAATIATNRGGLPEIVKHEVSGLICDPAEPGALAAAARRLQADDALFARLCDQAPSVVAPFLDGELMLDEYQALFETLARSNGPASSRKSHAIPE